jgi:uncharacterized protein (DUF934 family)
MPLYKDGAFRPDPWLSVEDGAPLPAAGPVVVSRSRFLAEAEALLARQDGVGVLLVPGESLDGVAGHLDRLPLMALRIAKYSDGRPYSVARLLRDRHGYTGELRATGDVLRDQVVFLLRAGFDALDVTHAGTIQALRDGTIVGVHRHYQPASAEAREQRFNQRPWLRVSAPIAPAG